MPQELWTIIWGALGTVVTALLTWATTRFVAWLNRKIKDKDIARWSTQTFTIIMNAVQAVFQSFVDSMKKAGKFDAAAAEEAKQRAYDIIVNQLTNELKQYITDNFGDMKAYIMNQIEAAIYQLKN